MKTVIMTQAFMASLIKRIWDSDSGEPVLAQTLGERILLSNLVFATFFSARGMFTRWSIKTVTATDLYHLVLPIGLFALLLGTKLPTWLALVLLVYVVYEVITWCLFDLFILLQIPDFQEHRTAARSFIWSAYSYGIVLLAYGLYFWSSGQILDSKGISLPSGLAGLYFSTVTIMTVGYGDYSPATNERVLQLVTAAEPLIGLVIVGVYLALIISVYASTVQKAIR